MTRPSERILSTAKTVASRRSVIKRRGARLRMFPIGVFDLEWFRIQTGRSFRVLQIAELEYERSKYWSVSPHPLFEPEFLYGTAFAKGKMSPLARYLAEPGGDRVLSPLFSEAAWVLSHPDATSHPGRVLGHFIEYATPATPLPVPADRIGPVPTWGQFRSAAFETARRTVAQQALTEDVTTDSFDESAGRRIIARWSAASVPSGQPVVSVVIPVYNRATAIREAVNSVASQTLAEWELLLVDDGSQDGSVEVIESLAMADPRIRVIRRPHEGVCAARNAGIAAASGKYMAFLDSDNAWEPDFLRVMVAYLHGTGSRAGYSIIDSQRSGSRRYFAFNGTRDHLLVKNFVPMPALVAETSLIREVGGFDPALRRWVDHDLMIRLADVVNLELVPFVGMRFAMDEEDRQRISVRESPNWAHVVLAKYLADWDADQVKQRVAGRVSILIPVYQNWELTIQAVRSVLANAEDTDIEVVVVDNGSRRCVSAILTAEFMHEPRITFWRETVNRMFATASNLAFLASTGQVVVFLNNDTEVRAGWLSPLVAALEDDLVLGAQPLLTFGDGTVQSAGTIFPGSDGLPSHLLDGHPVEDALAVLPYEFRAVTAAALAMRASDVEELRGFDPMFVNGFEDVDMCLRAAQLRPGHFVVVAESRVTHHESRAPGRFAAIHDNRRVFIDRWRGRLPQNEWEIFGRAELEVAWTDPGVASGPTDVRIPRPVLRRVVRPNVPPALRWAIKISAHPGGRGDLWGDVFFADSLAVALRRLGQDVVIDRRESFYRSTAYLDDVTLTIRGLDAFAPQPGVTNLLWVISHPDLVEAAELARFDLAFAASTTWAHRMSQKGVTVTPLLQATKFGPTESSASLTGHDVLFVGSSRRVDRPIVSDAVAAGLPLSVFGSDWEGRLDPRYLKGASIPNDQLAAAYASAGVVLCDHWGDMAKEGFLSNRLFDAVASGARVVSDQVAGIEEVFGTAVRTYSSIAELSQLAGPDGPNAFPDASERLRLAAEIAERHSFDARAVTLLDAVLAHRRSR